MQEGFCVRAEEEENGVKNQQLTQKGLGKRGGIFYIKSDENN